MGTSRSIRRKSKALQRPFWTSLPTCQIAAAGCPALRLSAQRTHCRIPRRRTGRRETRLRPKSIAFHHIMLLKRLQLTANIDIHILYTIEPLNRATAVIRDLDLTIQIRGVMKLAEPLILSAFRKENVRLLQALKH
jgi:hypothetical protein